MPNFKPGHQVHYIQARLALSERAAWRGATLARIEADHVIVVLHDDQTHPRRHLCTEAPRLKELIATHPVSRDDGGRVRVIVAPHHVLLVPHGNPGGSVPQTLGVLAGVTAIGEEGEALDSPAEGGGWGLFSIGPADRYQR